MNQDNEHTEIKDSSGVTRLYLAAEANDEDVVKSILASSAAGHDQLDVIETSKGWTPLFVACDKGYAPIVKLLVEAGANQILFDFAGWTAKEYAVYRGHLRVAILLASQDFSGCLPSWPHLQPLAKHPIKYQRKSDNSQIFVHLGASHTRTNLKPVEMGLDSLNSKMDIGHKSHFGVMIKAQGTNDHSPYRI